MKIGFIGLGNMGGAIIGGIIKSGLFAPGDIYGFDKSTEMAASAKDKYGINIGKNNPDVAGNVDVLVLAVKPIFAKEVITEIADATSEKTLIFSIMAGKTLDFIEKAFGSNKAKIVRAMPNTPALVGEGCTALSPNRNVTEEETELALKIARSFGKASVVPERLMDAVVAASGSSPAFVFMFIEALADSVVEAGMPRSQAYMFAAQTVLGSAKLMLETGRHPGDLKDMVCSPGGTTIEGVRVLEEKGFRAAVIDAAKAVAEKSARL
ncbi:MAG: pyrroline-5-carboxylate reductase [Lachnospiraceae bacterium]|nr:pyrroline-5-carboxylate reductase [Lachnospiraceae bacterium]